MGVLCVICCCCCLFLFVDCFTTVAVCVYCFCYQKIKRNDVPLKARSLIIMKTWVINSNYNGFVTELFNQVPVLKTAKSHAGYTVILIRFRSFFFLSLVQIVLEKNIPTIFTLLSVENTR